MSVLLFLMKKRVLLFSVVGYRVIGRHLRYLPLLLDVVVFMKERVLFILFGILSRFEFARKASVLDVVTAQRLVLGVVRDAVRGRIGRAHAPSEYVIVRAEWAPGAPVRGPLGGIAAAPAGAVGV